MLLNALEDCMLSLECDKSFRTFGSYIVIEKEFYKIQHTLISVMLEIESEYSKEKIN